MGKVKNVKKLILIFLAAVMLAMVAAAVSVAAAPDTHVDKAIIGKWLRDDGTYIIEIKSVDQKGVLDAAYYNPYPVHVGRAEAACKDGATLMYIELRDENYPGSNYHLAYDPKTDQLKGDYFQAVNREHYDIFFVRTK